MSEPFVKHNDGIIAFFLNGMRPSFVRDLIRTIESDLALCDTETHRAEMVSGLNLLYEYLADQNGLDESWPS